MNARTEPQHSKALRDLSKHDVVAALITARSHEAYAKESRVWRQVQDDPFLHADALLTHYRCRK